MTPSTVATSSTPEHPPEIPVEATSPARTTSLRAIAIQGSMWTMGAEFMSYGMRWAQNVILARILLPDAFGLMMIVNTVLIGLRMFSDVGVGPSIIQHSRGDDPRFLNTAWTIQIMRGTALLLCGVILSVPIARMYNEPILMGLMCFAAIQPFLDGFGSTQPSTWHRHVRIGRMTIFDLSIQVVLIASTLLIALYRRDVWALVLGSLISASYRLVASHFLKEGPRNRLCWDREATRDLVRFGRWIFISTVLTFVASHGDKLIMGKWLTKEKAGLYAIAVIYAFQPRDLIAKINSKVMFPLYSRVVNQSPDTLREKLWRARVPMLCTAIPLVSLCVVFGQVIVDMLYLDKYQDAGWMIQILAAGSVFAVITSTTSPVLLANGDSFRHMLLLIGRSVAMLGAMTVGGLLGGEQGLVIGMAAAPLLMYPVLAWCVRKYNAWMPGLDALAALAAAILISLGLWIMHLIQG
jgi:O-antigen/teichoic acid export membrane protein